MATVSNIPEPQPTLPRLDPTPKLRAGDRMNAAEFHRRYEAMPEIKKAELIDGVVYMPSPLKHDQHGRPTHQLNLWLGYYATYTPGVDAGDNSSVFLGDKNELQPDVLMRILPDRGGQSTMNEGYLEGPPELTAEVSHSSKRYDRTEKLEAYRRHGVREYLIWLVEDREIRWHVLEGERYMLLTADDGVLRSRVFPGLWLDPAALLHGALAKVLEVLQRGLATAEHRAFCERLKGELPPK